MFMRIPISMPGGTKSAALTDCPGSTVRERRVSLHPALIEI